VIGEDKEKIKSDFIQQSTFQLSIE
jgi:hypothetical protein